VSLFLYICIYAFHRFRIQSRWQKDVQYKYKVYNSKYYRYFACSIQMLYIIHCRQLIIWVLLNVRNSSKDKRACWLCKLLNTRGVWKVMPLWRHLAQAMWPWSRTCRNLFLVLWASVCHRVCHIMFIMDGSFSAVLKCIKRWIVVKFLMPKSETLQSWLVRIGLLWCRYCGHKSYAVGWENQGIMAKIRMWMTNRSVEDLSLRITIWTG
jgi:hypothetical protein